MILAFETALSGCSVAVYGDGEILSKRSESTPSKQAEILMSLAQEVLDEQRISYNDIDLFASSIGPGSFTGLRIGITAAKGLAMVVNKPKMGITTLEALAIRGLVNHEIRSNITAVINAGRGQFYMQNFTNSIAATNQPIMVDYDNFAGNIAADTTIISNCFELVCQNSDGCNVIKADIAPMAQYVAICASMHLKNGDNLALEPLYIRQPDAKISQRG